jgi:hypothetical protein
VSFAEEALIVMAGQKREAHLRARRPSHPRVASGQLKDVDARDKPGHDGKKQ